MATEQWPDLPFDQWQDTYATLHMWTQIVGKIRLACTPWINHSWHVTLYPTSRGLTTSPIPFEGRTFELVFDFLDHRLRVQTSGGEVREMALAPRTVADFYGELLGHLAALGIRVAVRPMPCEVPEAIPFDQDRRHAAYDSEYAWRWWRALASSAVVLQRFRARFVGKCSPVHFFWGSFDLAVTRFSGRPAPPHPGGVPNLPDWVAREAYSHEVSSSGFWAGGEPTPFPLYYAYAYPEPEGFSTAPVSPADAAYSPALREFVLPYDAVRKAASPESVLLDFLQSTYEAAAGPGHWQREDLERPEHRPPSGRGFIPPA